MRCFLISMVLGLLMAYPAVAETTAKAILIAPDGLLWPGEVTPVDVMFTNPSDAPLEVRIPDSVSYVLSGGTDSIRGQLNRTTLSAPSTLTLAPGAFVTEPYELTVPAAWTGFARLEVDLPEKPVVLVEVASPATQPAQAVRAPSTELALATEDAAADEDSVIETISAAVDEVYQPTEDAPFGIHEPMYFVYGLNPDEVKFQISFKYRLFHNIKDTSPLRWLQNLNVAYTQLSFWDFDSASKPFRDSSYKPELFFDIGDPSHPEGLIFPSLGLRHVRVGFMHESNGQDGLASRSLNYAYVQPEFVYDFERPAQGCRECEWWELSVKPKTWLYVGSTADNPDIDDFRGHAEIAVRLMQRNERRQSGLGLMASLRKGDAQEKATLQIDATTPFPFIQKLFTPNLHAQFISGYSESLLGFDQKDTRFRLGVGTRW